MPLSHTNAHALLRKKSARRTISTGQASRPGPEAEANTGRAPDVPPTEDADGLSATNSEVESAVNHRRAGLFFATHVFPKRRWTPLIREMRTSVPLKMV